jgi:transposase
MESLRVERLDHLGLIASVIKERRVIEMIDARLVPDAQEEITPGEAMAGMILNGLGFGNRPLSLRPQFFANKPLALLCREGVHAELVTRFTLGRTLDEVSAYGGDLWFSELALAVCVQEGLDQRFTHLDTTSCSLSGDDVPESDEHAIHLTDGDSKDHRPDLQQAVLELMVSQDGGVPLVSQSWDGHASDTKIVQERAEALMATFQRSPTPRYLVADSKLSHEDKAAHRNQLGFITRIPHTLTLGSQVVTQALNGDTWERLDDTTRSHRLEWCHDGMAQRWLVVSSQAALERAEATVSNACQREAEAITKQRFHVQAQRFETPEGAKAALAALENPWTHHQVEVYHLIEHQHDAHPGRPRHTPPITSIDWQIHAQIRADHQQMASHQHQKACFVVGSTIEVSQLSDLAVMAADKGQAQAEGGFRLLKNPLFVVSSLVVNKPWRIQGLLMVMTFARLVYSVTQRRVRHQLARQGETVPNQINRPTARPTLRWVFQRLAGMHRVRVTVPGQVHDLIEGLNEVHIKLLRLCGDEVCRLYQISPG